MTASKDNKDKVDDKRDDKRDDNKDVKRDGTKSGNSQEFILGWYGRPIAKMRHGEVEFGFDYDNGWLLPLESHKRQPGFYPMFLKNYVPQSVFNGAMNAELGHSMATYFSEQERFMSNLCVVSSVERLDEIGQDYLRARIQGFACEDAIFTGQTGESGVLSRELMSNMVKVSAEKRLTQVSGNQTKLPMYLAEDGTLELASHLPSTHIMKCASFGGDAQHIRGAAEWIGMTLVKAGGVSCAEFALLEMPVGEVMCLNYLTERFDIPIDAEDSRMIFCEELGSAMNMGHAASDMATLNLVIANLHELSTSKSKDMAELFKQVAANCILENADFHSRNMSLIKVAEPTLDSQRSVRLSPAYDVMRTRDFRKTPIAPSAREGMRLEFETPDGDYIDFVEPTARDFSVIGHAMGIDEAKVQHLLHSVALGMAQKAIDMQADLPRIFDRYENARNHVIETCEVVIRNAIDLAPSIEFDLEDPPVSAASRKRDRP